MKKNLSLLTLLLCICSGAWAEAVTIGITNTTTTTSKQATTETLTGDGDIITVAKLALSSSSQALSEYTTGDKAMNDGSSTSVYSTHTYKWNQNTGSKAASDLTEAYMNTNYPNEYVGFSFTVAEGKTFSISGIAAKLASSADHVFRIRIEDNSGNVLYTASAKQITRSSDNEQTITGLDSDNAADIQTLPAGTYKVKAFLMFNSTGKYLVFTKLQVTGTVGTAVADTRTAVTLSFPKANYEANLGESFTTPTLTVDPSAASDEVTYSSSTPGVATVDATTGAVTIVAAGETTITAAISNSTTYKDASASYTLTVTDPNAVNISATWAMADGANSQGVASVAETVMKMSWGMASNIKLHDTETATYGGTVVTQFVPIAKANDSERVNTNYVEFSMTPWKGLTFTPTAVSFEAFKVGTDGPKIDVDFIDGAGNTIKLETNAAITRNNKVGESGQANQVHNHTLTTAVASANAVKLRIYIRNCAADKNVAFGNIVITGTASGTAEALASYIVTTSMNIDGAGTISPLLGDNSVYEGNDIQLKATANTGYEFVNWTIDGTTQTANPYTISNINEAHTAVANFKQLLSITYAAGEGEGEVPTTAYADEGTTYTVAKSYFLKKDGNTLTGWTDGTNTYAAGETFTMPSSNVTLTAVFAENTESLTKTLSKTTVKWDFQQKNIGVFTSATSGWFVAQATINSKTIDVPMAFNKQIPNGAWQDWANAGNKPTLTIPAVSGMKVTLLTYNNPSTTTIAGTTDYTVTGSNNPYTVAYTYEGNDAAIDIVLNDAGYIRTLTVEYPKTHTYIDVTSVGYRTFASSSALDFTNGVEGLTAYRAEVANKLVSFKAIDCPVPAEEGMLIKANEGRYYIPLATGAPVAIENAFVGVTSATEIPAGSFVLMAATDNNQGTGFYKTASAFTVGANTAYLPSNVAGARTFIGFDFEDNTTTGVESSQFTVHSSQLVYNLNGQRVDNPKKGLYIVNGKKVIK